MVNRRHIFGLARQGAAPFRHALPAYGRGAAIRHPPERVDNGTRVEPSDARGIRLLAQSARPSERRIYGRIYTQQPRPVGIERHIRRFPFRDLGRQDSAQRLDAIHGAIRARHRPRLHPLRQPRNRVADKQLHRRAGHIVRHRIGTADRPSQRHDRPVAYIRLGVADNWRRGLRLLLIPRLAALHHPRRQPRHHRHRFAS